MIELGYFAMPLHPPQRNYREVLEENREAVVLADRLGFSEVWIGEHFTSMGEPVTNPFLFLATTIHATERIRFGAAVFNAPYHHPVHLAMQIAMFDQMSGGRAMVGIGPGGLPSDTEIFDIAPEDGHRMMAECVDMMIALWTGDAPIRLEGEFWRISLERFTAPEIGVGRLPKPLQRPHPPIAYAMRSPKSGSARLIAERGWLPISGNFIPASFVKSQWEDYAAECEAAGKRPDPENWRVARSILVAESDAEAADYLARAEDGLRFYFRYLRTLEVKRQMADLPAHEFQTEVETRINQSLEDQVIAGSAASVLDRLVAFREEVGPFGTLLMTGHDWDDRELWRGSMVRLAEEVMPRLRRHAAATDARSGR